MFAVTKKVTSTLEQAIQDVKDTILIEPFFQTLSDAALTHAALEWIVEV